MKVSEYEGQGHFLILFCAYTRLRYQVSVYRTIGPLVKIFCNNFLMKRYLRVHLLSRARLPKVSIFSGEYLTILIQACMCTAMETDSFLPCFKGL